MAAETTKGAQDKAQDDIATLREELAALRAVIDGLGPSARAGARMARDTASHAAESAQARAREYGEAAAASVRDSVHTHPLMSLGIAFAAGALAVLMIRR